MSMIDFIINGGLMGAMRGFDHNKEGRPYGWDEFGEDVSKGVNAIKPLKDLPPIPSLPPLSNDKHRLS